MTKPTRPFSKTRFWRPVYLLQALVTLVLFNSQLLAQPIDSLQALLSNMDDTLEKVDNLNKLAMQYRNVSDDLRLASADEARQLAHRLGYPVGESTALRIMGQALRQLGQPAAAADSILRSLTLLDDLQNPRETADAYSALGRCYATLKNYDEAIKVSMKAIDIFQRLDQKPPIAYICTEIGYRYWNLEMFDSALVYFNAAMELKDELPGQKIVANILNNMGVISYQQGDYTQALEYYLSSLDLRRELDDMRSISLVLSNIGKTYQDWKRYEDAEAYFREALQVGIDGQSDQQVGYAANNLGDLFSQKNQLDSAKVYYIKSMQSYQQIDDPHGIILNANGLGSVYLKQNQSLLAEEYLGWALHVADSIDFKLGMANSYRFLGELNLKQKHYQKAMKNLEASKAICISLNRPNLLKDVYELIADVFLAQNQALRAFENFQRFVSLKDSLYSADVAKNVDQLKIQFETEQKQREIEANQLLHDQQELTLQRTRLMLWTISAFLVVVVALAIGLHQISSRRKRDNELLKQSNSMKKLLLDVISHDLRNPAGVISGVAQMLQETDSENETYEFILSASNRLLEVIDHTSKLSAIAVGDKIDTELIPVRSMLFELSSEFETHLKQADIELEINIPEDLVIQANPIVAEVFKNYISNAIKYAPDTGKIIIDHEVGEMVRLNVKNFGATILEDQQQKIFLRSYRLEEHHQKKQGRGLGLAIVARIAQAHSGRAGVEAITPRGNCFYLEIPQISTRR